MTKDEALAFDLALEALRPFSTPNWAGTGVDKANEAITAITAIKQARLAPVQEPAEVLGHNGWGFPIKAAAPVQEDWGPGPHEYHSLTAAPVQEPVAWRYRGIFHEFDPSDWAEGPVTPLYTTPPAQPAPVQEPVAWLVEFENGEQELHFDKQSVGETQAPLYTTPPAAQRQWVRLTNEEISQIYLVNTDKPLKADWLFARAIEAKLKEKNT